MQHIGTIELQDRLGEYHVFEIVRDGDKLLAGSPTNTCFLIDYTYDLDEFLSTDEHIQEFITDIESKIEELEQ